MSLISSCGSASLSVLGTGSAFVEDPDSPLANLEERCGASLDDLSSSDYILVAETFQSLPMTTTGQRDGINYTVSSRASTTIEGRSGKSSTTTKVTIESMSGTDSSGTVLTPAALDKVVRPEAENTALDSTGASSTKSAPNTTILRYARTQTSYEKMLCSVSFSVRSRDEIGGSVGEVKFDLPAPLALNPKAALSTYESELGNGRTFQVNAFVITAKKDWFQVSGQAIPVEITWKKVSANLAESSQVTGQTFPSITADVAYEVSIAVTGGQPYALGLSKRRVFYVDSSQHRYAAIVDESGKLQTGTTDKVLPAAVLIPDPNF